MKKILLLIFMAITMTLSAQNTVTHIVKQNETLYSIAKKYGVTVNDILRVSPNTAKNVKKGKGLIIGQRLNIPKKTVQTSNKSNRGTAQSSSKPKNTTVQSSNKSLAQQKTQTSTTGTQSSTSGSTSSFQNGRVTGTAASNVSTTHTRTNEYLSKPIEPKSDLYMLNHTQHSNVYLAYMAADFENFKTSSRYGVGIDFRNCFNSYFGLSFCMTGNWGFVDKSSLWGQVGPNVSYYLNENFSVYCPLYWNVSYYNEKYTYGWTVSPRVEYNSFFAGLTVTGGFNSKSDIAVGLVAGFSFEL